METKRDLYIAKTFAGLEPLLEKELSEVGAEEVTVLRRAVSFTGDQKILYRANIWCRTALSILKQIHSFSFQDKDDFYDQLRQVDWTELFEKEKTFTIIPVAYNNEVFNNTMYLAQLSKDAVADCFTDKYGSRPDVDNASPNIRINVHVQNNQCSISLDSSGEALFKRGYRLAAGPAPINEILAAGLIMLSGWDKTSPFVDPMCGSGTFSIEAAMMSANMAPAANRKAFGFSHWPDFDEELLKQEQEAARSKETKVQADIIASDNMGFMLDHTRRNVMNAGFMGSIKVQKNDFFTYRPPYEAGWVILNPPYGKRMLNYEIDKLHEDIGEALKHRYTGFRAGIITSEIAAMRHIGLKPSFKTQVYNGPLQCVFNVYDLFAGKRKEREARSSKLEAGRKRADDWQSDERRRGPEDREARSWKEEAGRRRADDTDRRRKSEDKEGRSEDRSPRPDYRRKTEDRGWKSEGGKTRSPRPEYGKKRADERDSDDRRRRPEDREAQSWKLEAGRRRFEKGEEKWQDGNARSSKPEAGRKRADDTDRRRKSEDREGRSEDRSPRPDYRRKTEDRGWKPEGGKTRSPRPEYGKKRADERDSDDRRRRPEDREARSWKLEAGRRRFEKGEEKWQDGNARSSKPEAGRKRADDTDRRRKSEDREGRSEDRSPRPDYRRKTEDRGWKSEGGKTRSPRPEYGRKRADDREGKWQDRERKPDDRRPKPEYKGRGADDRRKPGGKRTGSGPHKPRK